MDNERSRLSRILPITGWLPGLTTVTIRGDLIAGIALAGLLVPEGLAYAGIAGVPPEVGLYSAAAGLAVYALFGSSRHLAVSCTSGSAAMLAALVGPLAACDPRRHAKASPEIDVTVLDTLEQLRSELNEKGIGLAFARISDSVRELLRRSGFLERLGERNLFWGVDSAVDVLTQPEDSRPPTIIVRPSVSH